MPMAKVWYLTGTEGSCSNTGKERSELQRNQNLNTETIPKQCRNGSSLFTICVFWTSYLPESGPSRYQPTPHSSATVALVDLQPKAGLLCALKHLKVAVVVALASPSLEIFEARSTLSFQDIWGLQWFTEQKHSSENWFYFPAVKTEENANWLPSFLHHLRDLRSFICFPRAQQEDGFKSKPPGTWIIGKAALLRITELKAKRSANCFEYWNSSPMFRP